MCGAVWGWFGNRRAGKLMPMREGQRTQSDRLIVLYAMIAPALWATSFLAVKYAVQTISPFAAAAFRFFLVFGIFWALLAIFQRDARPVKWSDVPLLAATGLFQTTLYFAFQYWGLTLTTASNAAVLSNTRPIFVAIIAMLFLHEAFLWRKTAGIGLAFVGVMFITGWGSLLGSVATPEQLIGDLLLLLNAISGAIGLVLTKRVVDMFGPLPSLAYTNSFGFLGLALLAGWELGRGATLSFAPAAPWLALVYQAVFTSVVAHFLWNSVLSKKDASWAAVFLYITPVVTVLLSWLLLGEELTWGLAVGAALVVLGTHLVTRSGRPGTDVRQEAVGDFDSRKEMDGK